MLSKLIKYDLENIFKVLSVFYCLSLVFAILTRIFFTIENSLVFNVIAQICSGITISMMFNIIINNIMRLWACFKQNLYSDQAYLTHTLPVEKRDLFFSKVYTSIITLFASILVIGISLFVAYYSKENLEILKSLLFPVADAYDASVLSFLLVLLGVLFFQYVSFVQCGFSGLILGHKMNVGKMGFSVLFGFITYSVTQVLALLILFLVALFVPELLEAFTTNQLSPDVSKTLIFICIGIYAVISVALIYFNLKIFKKGVDLD